MASRQFETGLKMQPDGADWLASAAVFDIERSNVLMPDLKVSKFAIHDCNSCTIIPQSILYRSSCVSASSFIIDF